MSLHETKKDAVELADVLPMFLETLSITELEQGIVDLPKFFSTDRLTRFMLKLMTETLTLKLQNAQDPVACNE